MNNFINNSQPYNSIYTYLGQVQTLYLQYIQVRTQLATAENNLNVLNADFNKLPTEHLLHSIQNEWNRKFALMSNISNIVIHIVTNLTEATKFALSSIQSSIAANNKLSAILNDNAIASICSIVEQDQQQLNLKEAYKQKCRIQNITMQISDIEVRAQMMRVPLPNFDRLKRIIRGY